MDVINDKYVDKDGNVFTFLYLARDFSTMESMVVYADLAGKIWVTPSSYFYDNHVIYSDCTTTIS